MAYSHEMLVPSELTVYVIVTIVSVIVAIYAKPIVNFFVRQQDVTTTTSHRKSTTTKTFFNAANQRRVCIVLGSGGHTSEMLRILKTIPVEWWKCNERVYLVSSTDTHSKQVAEDFEAYIASSLEKEQQHSQRSRANEHGQHWRVCIIPRAREVGQSYFTSTITTLYALCVCLRVVYRNQSTVYLTNGPGVCVPVIMAHYVLRFCLPWHQPQANIIYFESFTCVRHLSLSAQVLLRGRMVHTFTACWRTALIKAQHLLSHSTGTLRYVGCEANVVKHNNTPPYIAQDDNNSENTKSMSSVSNSASTNTTILHEHCKTHTALVTVGSTRFDKLIYAVVQDSVLRILHDKFGINHILLQQGSLREVQINNTGNVRVESFAYRPHLDVLIREKVDLVITHAGAGTILECLYAHTPTIVVPNTELMSNHQLELAEVLSAQHYLFYSPIELLEQKLEELDLAELHPFPGMNGNVLRQILSLPLTGNTFAVNAESET